MRLKYTADAGPVSGGDAMQTAPREGGWEPGGGNRGEAAEAEAVGVAFIFFVFKVLLLLLLLLLFLKFLFT